MVSPAPNSSFRYIRNVKRDDCFASGGDESYMYLSWASIEEGGHAPSAKVWSINCQVMELGRA